MMSSTAPGCLSARGLSLLLVVLSLGAAFADEAGFAKAYPADAGIGADRRVVFSADFESGRPDPWDDWDRNPVPSNLIVPDPGPFGISGNRAMRLRAPAGQRGGADLVKILPGSFDRLYARWYVKYESGFNFDAPNHGGGLHAGSRELLGRSGFRPSGDDWFSAWIEHATDTHRPAAYVYYRGMYQNCADPNGRCWGDLFPGNTKGPCAAKPQHQPTRELPKLVADRWYCLEMMLKAGDPTDTGEEASGVLNFWIDGVEAGPWTDLWLRTKASLEINTLWLNLFHHDGSHSDAGILIDNVVVAVERIGGAAQKAARD